MPVYKDASGREWRLRLTIGGLRRYEERTGISVLKAFLSKEQPFLSLVPDIRAASAILYECSTPVDGGQKPSFEEFCDNLDTGVLMRLGELVSEALKDSMPTQRAEGELRHKTQHP